MRVPFTFTRPGSGWVMNEQGIYVERGVDEPRYQWTPDGKSEGLLIEGQATNYALHSNNLADSSWGKQGISAELINDPKFPFPISRLAGTAQTDDRRGVWTQLHTVDPYFAEVGVPSIRGFIIKAGTQRYIWVGAGSSSTGSGLNNTSTLLSATFDLQTGQYLGEFDEYRVEPLGDGWFFCYRIYVPGNSTQYSRGLGLVFADEDGYNVTPQGTDLYVAGAVALKGDVVYSYTPTEGTPVTRPADTLYADMSLVEGFDPTQGTLIIDTDAKEAVTALAESGITIEGVEGKGKLVLTYDEDGGEVYASGAKQYGTDIPQATTFQPVTGGIALLREMVVWPRKFTPDEAKAEATGTLTMKPWTPAHLFKNGEVGVWFDPSDMSTMFQDAGGTTPVTEPGQPVGLILDKSQGLELGPELWDLGKTPSITNNTGSSGQWDASTGTISNSAVGSNPSYPRFIFNLGTEVGKRYFVSGILSGDISRVSNIRLGANVNDPSVISFDPTTGEMFGYVEATGGGIMFSTDGRYLFEVTIEELSIREIPGHHASQPTTTARPILGREPKSGRRNYLTHSEDLTNAAWATASGMTVTTVADPIYGSVSSLGKTIDSNIALIYQSSVTAPLEGTPVTLNVIMKAREGYSGETGLMNRSGGDPSLAFIRVNPATGSILNGERALDHGVIPLGDGYYHYWFAHENDETRAKNFALRLYSSVPVADDLLLVARCWTNPGIGPMPYQKVTSEYDITEEGVDDAYYLAFDGVDDVLQVPGFTVMASSEELSRISSVAFISNAVDPGYIYTHGDAKTKSSLGWAMTIYQLGSAQVTVGGNTLELKDSSGNSFNINNVPAHTTVIHNSGDSLSNVLGTCTGTVTVGSASQDKPLYLGAREKGVWLNGRIYGAVFLAKPSRFSLRTSEQLTEYMRGRIRN